MLSLRNSSRYFIKAVERVAPISAQECIVIGDTGYDGEAARTAGLLFIGVLCGGSSARHLREAGAIPIYGDPTDLLISYCRAGVGREEPSTELATLQSAS